MDEESQDLAEGETEGTTPSGGRGDAAAEDRASHLGFVAHEIRNPLSTALWTAELLGRMEASDRAGARGEKLAGMCLRSLQRVRNLVEDHLLSERLDTGIFPVRPEGVSLVDQVVAAEGRRGAADGPSSWILLDLGVLADRALLGRMIDALLDAASQGVSAVKVSGRASDGEVGSWSAVPCPIPGPWRTRSRVRPRTRGAGRSPSLLPGAPRREWADGWSCAGARSS